MVERAAAQPLEREDPQHLVAVDEPPARVHRDAPVGVAVEREAHVRAEVADRGHQRLGVGGAAVAVDVVAVGRVVDHASRGRPVASRIRGATR